MTENQPLQRLCEYNDIMKENDQLYRALARHFGLPECRFWILYALRAEEGIITQGDICQVLYEPKQTVNSALKQMEAEGDIRLTHTGGRRGKEVALTAQGLALARQTADQVISAEARAMEALTQAEQNALLSLLRKYTAAFRGEAAGITVAPAP